MRITSAFLAERAARSMGKGFAKQKWIEFCETMLAHGFEVHFREVQVSKYITVCHGGRSFKVRFSNHSAVHRGPEEQCDFFVGKNTFGTTNTAQAIAATLKFFGSVMDAMKACRHWSEVLGVRNDATNAAVIKAYRKLAKDNHPDRGGDHNKAIAINRAFSEFKQDRHL